MLKQRSGVVLLKEYFGDVRPVDMAELKALGTAERQQLADETAASLGLKRVATAGGVVYEG